MCHTELAVKKKCNSLDWRHGKYFQIYLQDNLELILQPLVSDRKQNSMQTQMLQYGRSVMTSCSKFFLWKTVLPILVALKNFSQIKTKSIISLDFRPSQRGWCCHSCHCFLWQRTHTVLLTYRRIGWRGEESVPLCVLFSPLTIKEGWMSWFNLFLVILTSVESSTSIFLDSPCRHNTELSTCGV